MDVVGALIYEGKLISKGLSNGDGQLVIDFPNEYANSEMTLYLNKDQYSLAIRLVESLEENDDVQNVYTNLKKKKFN